MSSSAKYFISIKGILANKQVNILLMFLIKTRACSDSVQGMNRLSEK